jgi:hypothetical protein
MEKSKECLRWDINKINNQLIIKNKVILFLIKSLEVTRKRVEYVLDRVSTENKKNHPSVSNFNREVNLKHLEIKIIIF